MKKTTTPLLHELERFIVASRTGRRRKPDGNKVTGGTIKTYENCLRLVKLLSAKDGAGWEIPTSMKVSREIFRKTKLYWARFARNFSDFAYGRGNFDNYVAGLFKVLRTLFHYLEEQYGWPVRHLLPFRLVRTEEIPVLTLSTEQFRYILDDEGFLTGLSKRQRIVRDIFIVGCATALRVSDLFRIRRRNLVVDGERTWLVMRSQKTGTETRLLLPNFVEDIFSRYHLKAGRLLPKISNVNLNIQIKKLASIAGWTDPILRYRNRRGIPQICGLIHRQKPIRFCDMLTSHTMRRTGISLLLQMGVPEQLVRQVSGHKPGSREFYRYVSRNQKWQDEQTEKAFTKLIDQSPGWPDSDHIK
jgi:integrase